VEDPTTGDGTVTYGTQDTPLSAPGSTPIGVAAPISCQCGNPGYNWIYSNSSAVGSANVSLLPNPSLHATANLLIPSAFGAGGNASVDAEIHYSFEIVDNSDPTGHSMVPILVNAAGGYTYSVNTPGYEEFIENDVESLFYVNGWLTDSVSWYTNVDGILAPGSKSWSDNNTYELLTNVVYDVGLVAYFDVGMYGGEGGGGQAVSVYVDPTFAIGSGVDPSRYALVFSDGVGNSAVAATPEPATWAMVLAGFAGLGLAGYRGQKSRAIAA
jgi:hypothetical protein